MIWPVRKKVTDRQISRQSHTETDKPTAIGEILQICLIIAVVDHYSKLLTKLQILIVGNIVLWQFCNLNWLNHVVIFFGIFIYYLLYIYVSHVLTPLSGRQVRESRSWAPSRVLSCTSDRPFVIERQVCSLSTEQQLSTTLHYTIRVCVQPYS